jgi:hypothetical protein
MKATSDGCANYHNLFPVGPIHSYRGVEVKFVE